MKNQKLILMLLIMCSLFTKCNCSDELEDDAPVIVVETPDMDDIFYTENSVGVRDFLYMRALASDDSNIKKGAVTIFNSGGTQVYYFEALASRYNRKSINEINTSFYTSIEDEYTVVFEFTDSHGNSSTVTRLVTCEALIDVETDNIPT